MRFVCRMSYGPRACACLLLLLISLAAAGIPRASAAMYEDGTTLAYLIELFRRQNTSCPGEGGYGPPPPLLYSDALTRAAEDFSLSGLPLSESGGIIARNLAQDGLEARKFRVLTAVDESAQSAFARLKEDQCGALREDMTQIGAFRGQDRWWIIMAVLQPLSQPSAEGLDGTDDSGAADAAAPDAVAGAAVPPASGGAAPAVDSASNPVPALVQTSESGLVSVPVSGSAAPVLDLLVQNSPAALPEASEALTPEAANAGQGSEAPLLSPYPAGVSAASSASVRAGTAGSSGTAGAQTGVAVPSSTAQLPAAVPASVSAPSSASSAAALSPAAQELRHTSPALSMPPLSAEVSAMLARINDARAQGGKCPDVSGKPSGPLAPNAALMLAADEYVREMNEQRYFAVASPTGRTMEQRILERGYTRQTLSMLIAKGPANASVILDMWLARPDQCMQVNNPLFQDIGIGYTNGIWAVVMALPTPVSAPLAPKDDPSQTEPQPRPINP